MPEINNKETKSITKPDSQFVLPQRRGYSKYLIIPVALIVLAGAGWIAYTAFTKPAAAPSSDPQPIQEEQIQVKSGISFYLASDREGDSSVEKTTRLYQYVPDANSDDKKIVETKEKFFDVVAKTLEPYVYIAASANHKFFKLNAATGKIDELFELAEDPMLREVAVSSDGKWLAYARNYEGSANGKSGGSIWLYNFETKEQTELVKKTELGLYQGFSVLGWRNNNTELVVSSLGGDAGSTWGDIHLVSIATGAITKITPVAQKDSMNFLRGSLSPDGDKWLFTYCEKPDEAAREKDGSQACASGTELKLYNFENKDIKTVYQNLRYADNVNKNSLRTIMDSSWVGDNSIIAAVPGALLDITVSSGKAEELYLFDRYNPQNYGTSFTQLRNANKDQIVFNDDDEWKIFDRHSKKLVSINRDKEKETIIHWLD